MNLQLQSALGIVALLAIAWAVGAARSRSLPALPWRAILIGVGAQFVIAGLLLYLPPLRAALSAFGSGIDALARATEAGTGFVFGYLGGAPLPFQEVVPGASFILAFRALPLVLVIGALSAVLYHWGVLPWLVARVAGALRIGFGLGGAAGFSVAANVFVGMVEAPLLIRPYLKTLDRGELFAVMTAGMGTIAGNVLAIYAVFLRDVVPDAAGQLLVASFVATPACVLAARLIVPPGPAPDDPAPTVAPEPFGGAYSSTMEALARGTAEGLALMLGIIAALVVFVSLVALANEVLVPVTGLTLPALLAIPFRPVAWLLGIPWEETPRAGQLLGVKTAVNEFVAYLELAKAGPDLSPRTSLILTYALSGFANIGSVGILVGGMAAMAPERRGDIAGLALLTLVSGSIATFLAGAVIGVMTPG